MPASEDVYSAVIERVFFSHFPAEPEPVFTRDELVSAANDLGLARPKNLGDVIYSFRFRRRLPHAILETAPDDREWLLRLAGSGRYRFTLAKLSVIEPAQGRARIKIPDATPGVIKMYSLSDEQALLAILRYNRLIDIFTRVTCYPLQSHLRTQIRGRGQVETDDIYVGVDRGGSHYVIPVQAKGSSDILSVVQIEQDIEVCRDKFSSLIIRPIAVQFLADDAIAMFELQQDADKEVVVAHEQHYRLVEPDEIDTVDLQSYRSRS